MAITVQEYQKFLLMSITSQLIENTSS